MAFQLVAGGAANAANGLGIGNMFAARDVAGFSANSGAFVARAESGPETVNLFIDADDEDYEYAASVVDACKDHTVYAVQCTAGVAGLCGSDFPPQTITENASQYRVSTASATKTEGVEAKATLVEECALAGTTEAACTATLAYDVDGRKFTTSAVTTYAGTNALRFDVAITAGGEKLANPTGSCKSAAATTSTRAVALWGLLGAVGAIGVLAL